ncbi:hypothetical protein C8J57DRAFT_1562100 [Mycena rebaudengoi]|nr:hypothetical protein C8J57DRAFT_1562100 [Mycena rebaudengoi]
MEQEIFGKWSGTGCGTGAQAAAALAVCVVPIRRECSDDCGAGARLAGAVLCRGLGRSAEGEVVGADEIPSAVEDGKSAGGQGGWRFWGGYEPASGGSGTWGAELSSTAYFYYVEQSIWALIMAQTTLNIYAADQIFNYVNRLGGTFSVLYLAWWHDTQEMDAGLGILMGLPLHSESSFSHSYS